MICDKGKHGEFMPLKIHGDGSPRKPEEHVAHEKNAVVPPLRESTHRCMPQRGKLRADQLCCPHGGNRLI